MLKMIKRMNRFVILSTYVVFINILLISNVMASTPENVIVSNVRGGQFSVSWTSKNNETGYINVGLNQGSLLPAYDDRESNQAILEDDTHHVTVEGLNSNTIYYYEIVSGGEIYNNDGNYFSITTGPDIVAPVDPCQPAGKVFKDQSKTQPAYDSIVYITVMGETEEQNSAIESTLVTSDTNGYWFLNLVNIRSKDYNSLYPLTCGTSQIQIDVQSANDGTAYTIASAINYPPESPELIVSRQISSSVQISCETSTITEKEEEISIIFTLTEAVDEDVIVPFNVNGTATPEVDHNLTNGNMIIPANQTTASKSFTIIDDNECESDETIVITIEKPANAGLGSITSCTITLSNDEIDCKKPTVNFKYETDTASENDGLATIIVTLSEAIDENVLVPYRVNGTATIGQDHDLTDGSFTIMANQTSGNKTFGIINDNDCEPDETIIITLETPTNADLGTKASRTITLLNDASDCPKPTVNLEYETISILENQGVVSIKVTLSEAIDNDVIVFYELNGTATSGNDHNLTSGSITIPANQTFSNIEFNITDDNDCEPDETIVITLETPTNADLGTKTSCTITLLNDSNDCPKPTVNIECQPIEIEEDEGLVSIKVTLSESIDEDVNISYIVDGTAISGVDHNLTNGIITIFSNQTIANKSFYITDDNQYEQEETIIISLEKPNNADLGSNVSCHINILESDIPTVQWSVSSQSILENIGTVNITASLNQVCSIDINVPYVVNGTSMQNVDHTLSEGTIIIPAGQFTKSQSFQIVEDDLEEDDETIIITITDDTNAYVGGIASQTITIIDHTRPIVEWDNALLLVLEDSGSVTITAVLSKATNFELSVPYTVNGTATYPFDHELSEGDIIFSANNQIAVKTFNLRNDHICDENKTIIISLMETIDVKTGQINSQTITIIDNDCPPTVNWLIESQSVSENITSVEITASLNYSTENNVIVPYTVAGTALNAVDYTIENFEIIIPAGHTTSSQFVHILNDNNAENNETIIFTIQQPINAEPGTLTNHTLSIIDNDNPPPSGGGGGDGGGGCFIHTAKTINYIDVWNYLIHLICNN